MLALIVVANPSPNSLSHAMASTAQRVLAERGYEIAHHDLYAEHFDPVQPTGEHKNVESIPIGLLRARLAIVINTSNTPAEREATAFGDPLEALWKNCVFGLCGVSNVMRRMYGPVSGSTAQQRAAWLSEVAALVESAA